MPDYVSQSSYAVALDLLKNWLLACRRNQEFDSVP